MPQSDFEEGNIEDNWRNFVIDLNAYNQVVGKSKRTYEDSISRALDERTKASELSQFVYDSKGNTPEEIEAVMRGNQKVQEQSNFLMQTLGIGTPDPYDELNRIGAENAELHAEAVRAREVIDQKQSVDFFSNPLQYIVNQLTVDNDIAQYNAAANKYNLNALQQENLHTSVQSGHNTYKAGAVTINESAIKAATTASLAFQKRALHEMQAETYKSNADAVRQSLEFDALTIQNKQAIYSTWNQTYSLKMQEERLKLAEEAGQRAKDAAKEDESFFVESYKEGYKSIHGVEPPISSVKDLKAMMMSPRLKAQIEKYVDIGIGLKSGLDAPGQLGMTPWAAMETIETLKVPLSTSTSHIYEKVHKQAARMLDSIDPLDPNKPKNKDEAQRWINNQAFLLAKHDAINIPSGDKANIYAAPPLKTLASYKSLQELPVFKKYLETQLTESKDDLTPQEIASHLIAAVKGGYVSAEDAAYTGAHIYATAILYNNTNNQYVKLGLPAQDSYVTSIKLEGTRVPAPGVLAFPSLYPEVGQTNKAYNLNNINEWKRLILEGSMSGIERGAREGTGFPIKPDNLSPEEIKKLQNRNTTPTSNNSMPGLQESRPNRESIVPAGLNAEIRERELKKVGDEFNKLKASYKAGKVKKEVYDAEVDRLQSQAEEISAKYK